MGSQILPIPSILNLAKISMYLAKYDVALDTGLNGGSLNSSLPREIYELITAVEWMYSKNPNEVNLVKVGNDLYAICGRYIPVAKTILGSQGGIPINPSVSTNAYVFRQILLNVNGNSGEPVAGTYVYQNADLIQASQLFQLSINGSTFYKGTNFTFEPLIGKITFINYVWNTDDIGVLTFSQKVN
jgi:hypothetical protein